MTAPADFLLARILEDERDAVKDRAALGESRYHRSIEECASKRRIVELADYWRGDANDYGQMDQVLRLLALPYANHPDYREEWRPA